MAYICFGKIFGNELECNIMKIQNSLFLFCILVFSCEQQTFNSSIGDENLGGNDCTSFSGAELRFCNSHNIILKRCVSCHTGYHNSYANLTESDYVDNFLITPGDSAGSSIFSRLINEGSNMPKDGKPLSDDEYTELMEWIDQVPSE